MQNSANMEKEEEEEEKYTTFHSPSADESSLPRFHPSESSPPDSPVSYQTSHAFSPKEENHKTPPIPPEDVPETFHSPIVVVNRSVRDEPRMVTKVDPGALDGIASIAVEEGGGASARRGKLSFSMLKRSKRESAVERGALVFRICGFLFCLISFSIMASDKNKGWTLDSFDRYEEFRCVSLSAVFFNFHHTMKSIKRVICRYCLSVNVIGFVYSGLQGCDLAYHMGTGKHALRHHLRRHLDFFMDQASQLSDLTKIPNTSLQLLKYFVNLTIPVGH